MIENALKQEAIHAASRKLLSAASEAEKFRVVLRLEAYLMDPANPMSAMKELEHRHGIS